MAAVTLNNPARLNPISRTLQASLRQVLALIAADSTVRALVLTGAGRAFCSGADLSAMSPHGRSEGRNTAARSAEPALIRPDDVSGRSLGNTSADAMHAVTNRRVSDLRALPLPVVCAINGVAAGGGLGLGLGLAGDVVLAQRSAHFYLPFMAKLGIVPDVGSTWCYRRLLGTGRATALTLLGDKLPAEKCRRLGTGVGLPGRRRADARGDVDRPPPQHRAGPRRAGDPPRL